MVIPETLMGWMIGDPMTICWLRSMLMLTGFLVDSNTLLGAPQAMDNRHTRGKTLMQAQDIITVRSFLWAAAALSHCTGHWPTVVAWA